MHRRGERSLTPRQAQIAALVRAGKTSRQIGQELFIDSRTVDSHVDAICTKLDVRTRAEMVFALYGPHTANNARPTHIPKTNLPAARARLIGREAEVDGIALLLGENRLVTVTGSGGIGKTRTALAVGDKLLAQRPDGVWLVDLAPLTDGSAVPASLAGVLGIQESIKQPLFETLVTNLKHKALLVILDNCEHVIAQAAELANVLLCACAGLTILATSREPLRVAGEQTYRMPPLRVPTPPQASAISAAKAAEYSAVALFAERAQAIDRGFRLTDENAQIVCQICRQLEGTPLAIELAAARVDSMPVRVLSTKLDRCLQVLTRGDRTALPRHQTMRALIDWSYNLLSAPEQRLFARMAIFAGSCTQAMAEVVDAEGVRDEPGMLELLSSLVGKSLIVADLERYEARYRLAESCRQYALEKLEESGQAATIAHRHAVACTIVAEKLESQHQIAADSTWLAQAPSHMENWLAALHWTLLGRGDVALGQRLAIHLRPVWQNFALAGGRRWLRTALALADDETPKQLRADLEFAAVSIAFWFGEWSATLATSLRLISMYQELGDSFGTARARFFAGESLLFLGRREEALPLLEQAFRSAREFGNQRFLASTLERIAGARSVAGKHAEARAHLTEALAIYRESGHILGAANAAGNLAEAEFLAGNVDRALDLVLDSIVTAREYRDMIYLGNALLNASAYFSASERFNEAHLFASEALEIALQTERPAYVAFALQHLAASVILSGVDLAALPIQAAIVARLWGFVDARVAALGTAREYTEQQEYDRAMSVLRDRLRDEDLTRYMSDGAAMHQKRAIEAAHALGTTSVIAKNVAD